jgi:hypothetical protein
MYHSLIKTHSSWAPVAHPYNPSYSGGRDQEDRGLRPARTNSSRDTISKILNTETLSRKKLIQKSGLAE